MKTMNTLSQDQFIRDIIIGLNIRIKEYVDAIAAEQSAREDGDSGNTSALASEIAARIAADLVISNKVDGLLDTIMISELSGDYSIMFQNDGSILTEI